MMGRITSLAFAVAASLAVGACAASTGAGDAGDGPVTGPEQSASTLVVTTTYRQGQNGMVYREGAMADVILLDADGSTVDVQTKSPGDPLTFKDLEPGTYVLKPALRPCDGNCGYLDPRLDGCSRTVALDSDVHVRVDFTVGVPCRVHTMASGS